MCLMSSDLINSNILVKIALHATFGKRYGSLKKSLVIFLLLTHFSFNNFLYLNKTSSNS